MTSSEPTTDADRVEEPSDAPAIELPERAEPVPPRPPRLRRWLVAVGGWARSFAVSIADYFRMRDPTFRVALLPSLVVSALLFVRSPFSNYIFDEQEALLANPYVNGRIAFRAVLTRDFWGLPHDRSIGSYRPLPNVIWRAVWQIHPVFRHPWALHWINIVVHALNAALVARIAFGLTKDRTTGWLAGAVFATSAVLTEAVTGVVGIADVLGALGVFGAVLALEASLVWMPFLVFASATVGFFSKESTLVALPILAFAALTAAPLQHPKRPLAALRALLALGAGAAALVLYTETRRRYFPSEPPTALLATPGEPFVARTFHAFLHWFQQPRLPQDPINNPLINADVPHRIAGALGVYASGVGQVLVPVTLSGDYSFPQEPIPARVVGVRSIAGAALLILPLVAAFAAWIVAIVRRRAGNLSGARATTLLAIGLAWVPIAYFPHSNIPILLPTVRAERFWYLPAAGVALVLAVVFARLLRRERLFGVAAGGVWVVAMFLAFQATRARMHALDYADDLVFWRATAHAVPNSAKAHLNYGVMLGARNELGPRLVENRKAMELAPAWPMAHIYYADTLCRLGRLQEAWPDYATGFVLGPNDRNLIALGLQCLWDHGDVPNRSKALIKLSDEHPGTWLSYLARDIVTNGTREGGVDRKYRPRGYDEGPSD